MTLTSAEVNWAPLNNGYQFIVTVPASETAALKAVTTTAYDSHGFTGITVDGKTWELRRAYTPLGGGQFAIQIKTRTPLISYWASWCRPPDWRSALIQQTMS